MKIVMDVLVYIPLQAECEVQFRSFTGPRDLGNVNYLL